MNEQSERGVVFVNPKSGNGNDGDDLAEEFAAHEIVESKPDELDQQVRDALTRAAPPAFVGVAGGDGTIRTVVGALLDTAPATPLLVVPAGTRNHFAHDLGVDEIGDAVQAARSASTRSIDVGRVNGEVFVNNSSIGVYPRLVEQREVRERRLPKSLATVGAAWHQLRRAHWSTIEIDGTPCRVWAVFVGNNCYGDSLRDFIGRERLDEGVLDVRVVHADRRLSRLRIAGALLFGRLDRSPLIERSSPSSVVLDRGEGAPVDVALDGEVTTMQSPLRYESAPKALTVFVRFEPANFGG